MVCDVALDSWYPFPAASILTNGQVVFLAAVYGYVLFAAAGLLGDGAEMLLLVQEYAGLVGSVVIPILGAVPDGMMVLFSGMGENAQEEVSVGVGALAGSTVMLLTVPWFISVFAGRVNVVNGQPTYKRPKGVDAGEFEKLSPPGHISLTGTGVTFNQEVRDNAKMMFMTLFGYLIIQLPALSIDQLPVPKDDTPAELRQERQREAKVENPWALAGLIVCMAEFGYYLFREWVGAQKSEGEVENFILEKTRQAIQDGRLTLRGAMANFKDRQWAAISSKGDLEEMLISNKESLEEVRRMCKILAPFFAQYDVNGDNSIDFEEFRMIFRDVGENLSKDAQIAMFNAADTDKSGNINFEEFVACLMSFALDPSFTSEAEENGTAGRRRKTSLSKYVHNQDEEGDGDDEEDEEGGEEEEDFPPDLADLEPEEQQRLIKRRAFGRMGIGTLLVLIFSDPMVELLTEMGVRLHINSFYVSFVLAPLASNASELVAAYTLAKKRTVKSMTSSLLSLLGAGIMNNTFVLGIFLALIWYMRLAWTFTAETISIICIELMMVVTVFSKGYQTVLNAIVILCYYPISLGIVYFLENVMGLD